MSALKVHVEHGRIKLDEDRKRLHESIRRGIEDGRAGRVTDFDECLVEL